MSAMVIFGGRVSGKGSNAQHRSYKRRYDFISIRRACAFACITVVGQHIPEHGQPGHLYAAAFSVP